MRLALLIAAAILCGLQARAKTAVWIDTDPSVARGGHEEDDGFALLQAFRSPELSIRGISVVFGNAPLGEAYPIGQRLVRDFGPPGTRVYRGAATAKERGKETDASRALANALRHESLTIVAIGPATNVATVLQNHPELAGRIDRLIAVAGRRRNQHFTAGAAGAAFRDFNFELDPAAFQTILNSKVPLVLAPWEISSHVWLHAADLARIRAAQPNAGWMLDAAADWLAYWKSHFGVDGFNPFDTLAVGYAASPKGFGCQAMPVKIETAPDDTGAAGSPAKPYLIVDPTRKTDRSALYCYRPPVGFAESLVDRLCSSNTDAATSHLDHSAWNTLLGKYVNAEARVDYRSLKQHDLNTLDAYLIQLAQPWPKTMNAAETKAALIDAYNALTVRWIETNYPTESIWRTHHPFTEARHMLNGTKVSLDQIEKRLRDLGDPRIHSALVCASLSCPPLRREAYYGARLDRQLDDNVRSWLANPQANQFDASRRQATVSMIFKWYAGDFQKGFGSAEKFLADYGPSGKTAFLLQPGVKLDYFPYRWGINDVSDLGMSYSGFQFYRDAMKNKYF